MRSNPYSVPSGGRVSSGNPGLWLALTTAVTITVALVLAGTLLELAALFLLKRLDDRFLFLAPASAWWIPLGLGVPALALLAVLWALGCRWQRLRGPGAVVGVLAGWVAWSPLLVFQPRLHPAAALLLAAGIGTQLGRLAVRYPSRLRPLAWRAVATLGPVLLVIGQGVQTIERRNRLEGADLGPTPRGMPNVLLLILDTVRAADMSLYGYEHPTTPFLQELGARGVVFRRAVAPSSWTLPSHASVFTGRWPHALEADWLTTLSPEASTLAEQFRRAGYRTGGFVGNVTYVAAETGLGQGFATYEVRRFKLGEVIHAVAVGRFLVEAPRTRNLLGESWLLDRNSAGVLGARFREWVGEGETERPFFGFLNLYDAHLPFDPAPAERGRFGPQSTLPWRSRLRRFLDGVGPLRPRDSTWLREARARYDEAIATMDAEIRRIVDGLERRGLLDSTILIVTSDHGELFGEDGLFGHGNGLHVNTLRVPLLIVAPGRAPAGRMVEQVVSLRDLPATIADLAGLESGRHEGHSLRPLWEGSSEVPRSPALSMISRVPEPGRRIPIAIGDMASIIADTIQVIVRTDGLREVRILSDAPPWARPGDPAPVRADTRVGRLTDSVWYLWGGRSSRAPRLTKGNWVVHERPPCCEPSPVLAVADLVVQPARQMTRWPEGFGPIPGVGKPSREVDTPFSNCCIHATVRRAGVSVGSGSPGVGTSQLLRRRMVQGTHPRR